MIFFQNTYKKLILDRPSLALFILFCCIAFFTFHAPGFRLDASSESLSLENDKALQYYRSIKAQYGSDDYLVVTFEPLSGEVFDQDNLTNLATLRNELSSLDRLKSLISILDVPLVKSPPVTLEDIRKEYYTLLNPKTDHHLARKELVTSPFFSDLLISQDGQITALFLEYQPDSELLKLIHKRDALKEKSIKSSLTEKEIKELHAIEQQYKNQNTQSQKQQEKDIKAVRDILQKYKNHAQIHLGGVPMIVSDSIDYIDRDLKIFGTAVFCFLILLLTLIFRKPRWIFLPMLICFAVGISIVGFLGLVNWPATIVSANFISLILIFTLSFCVHQIVRYREFSMDNPKSSQYDLVQNMIFDISVPCFYMAFTTAIGFCSLIVSDIRPVIDFGWMMAVGIIFSFVISFTLMPALLMFLEPEKKIEHFDFTGKITDFFAQNIEKHSKLVLWGFGVLLVLSIWGMSFLYVQNRFIDYYKKDTEIYQGMETIDTKLGGTTPLDVVIYAPQSFIDFQEEETAFLKEAGMVNDSPDILRGYWFSETLMQDAKKIHDYLDSLPETGKVLSFYTTVKILQEIEKDQLIDRFYLGVLYNNLPETVKEMLFTPYISEDGNQLRFSVRIFESKQGLNREELLQSIKHQLTTDLGLEENQIHLTGMVVLYNNILQSLFKSQILTVGVVFITMFFIFILLFRNIKIAAVAIIPNITIVVFVLGLMGWLGIPLDIMTITIAAICFGMADDNTIHYIHRFREEFKKCGNYWQAVRKSHDTIGRAMYYTTVTVMFGFSILVFSNFVPTIYFGLLTSFAMLIALLADLALLPLLITFFKPLGRE